MEQNNNFDDDRQTINTYAPMEEIDSTFQQINNIENDTRFPHYVTEAFEATHVYDKWAVTRTYTVERFDRDDSDDRVSVYIEYTADGEEVDVQEHFFELTDDGCHVEHSGEDIETFCRANHNADPQIDIEIAMEN